jgi:hypothetical protein
LIKQADLSSTNYRTKFGRSRIEVLFLVVAHFGILRDLEANNKFTILITSISGAAIHQVHQPSSSDTTLCSRPGGPRDLGDEGFVDAQEIAQFFGDMPKILG